VFRRGLSILEIYHEFIFPSVSFANALSNSAGLITGTRGLSKPKPILFYKYGNTDYTKIEDPEKCFNAAIANTVLLERKIFENTELGFSNTIRQSKVDTLYDIPKNFPHVQKVELDIK
jgi:hypothetical protein